MRVGTGTFPTLPQYFWPGGLVFLPCAHGVTIACYSIVIVIHYGVTLFSSECMPPLTRIHATPCMWICYYVFDVRSALYLPILCAIYALNGRSSDPLECVHKMSVWCFSLFVRPRSFPFAKNLTSTVCCLPVIRLPRHSCLRFALTSSLSSWF